MPRLDDLARREAAGEIFVVRPSESVKVPSLCREPDELERIYQVGRRDAGATLPALEAYLAGIRAAYGKRIPEWRSKLGCAFRC